VPDAPGYLKVALDISDEIYPTKAYSLLDAPVGDSDSILKKIDIERSQAAAQMLVLKCSTQTSKIKIGDTIIINFPNDWNLSTTAGRFIITEVLHEMKGKDMYENHFTAYPASVGYLPIPKIHCPMTVSQRATVLSNADPEGKGRIRVQHQWQKEIGKNTNWIRVQTPDAGGSDKVKSNRGFVFIPEAGDDVMVTFEYGDPSRPFVQGSIFSSKSGGGGGQGNKTKSLTSRSGSTVTLDDSNGSVRIADQTGNDHIVFDGVNKITVTADNQITLTNNKCTIEMINDKIRIYAPEEISIESKLIGILATDKLEIRAKEGDTKDMVVNVNNSLIISSKNEIKMTADSKMEIGSKQIDMAAKSQINIGSQEVNINS
ncbi:MAG: hypothetical protein RL662_750, partial [Bacteroidota bacterium]